MTHELLVEIGVEDVPPFAVDTLCEQLERLTRQALQAARLEFEGLSVYSAPRRLALGVQGLAERQPDRVREVRGPARKVAFDAAGQPTPAAEGFCRGHGARVEDAHVQTLDGGEYLCLKVEERGLPAGQVLTKLLPGVLKKLVPPETMRWNGAGARFIRPVRWLVGLLDGTVVPFEWAGLRAADLTYGHRRAGDATLRLGTAREYRQKLEENGVLVDPQARRDAIQAQLAQAEREHGARFAPDEALLHTLVHSAEWPSAVAGQFDERFLKLPAEVLSTTMIQHQRFVPAFEREGGKILPRFLGFRDGPTGSVEEVRRGYERVLGARLVDSEYFFSQDRQRKLAEYTAALKSVVYQARLGSLWDKTQRVRALAGALGNQLGFPPRQLEALDRAAFLCKADLVTLMVGEFPELQGVMGGLYAQLDGEPQAASQAVREHYLPQGPRDPLPATPLGTCLSLADKLDSVTGALLIGQRPSGSRDPFGLRRAANAIVRVVLRQELEVDLFRLVRERTDLYAFLPERRPLEEVEAFLGERLGQSLMGQFGLTYDVVEAVLAPRDGHFLNVLRKARSLEGLRGSADLAALVSTFSRAHNILTKSKSLSTTTSPNPPTNSKGYDPQRFVAQAERDLWRALLKAETQVEKRLPQADFEGILAQLLRLKDPIDAYFDEVMVMCDDPALRHNRLSFLQAVVDQFMRVGDLSRLVLEGDPAGV